VPCDTLLLDSIVNAAIPGSQCLPPHEQKAATEREQRKSFLAFKLIRVYSRNSRLALSAF
jgi:hypothetical protein